MKKLLVLVALGIFLAAHGVVTAMTFHARNAVHRVPIEVA